MFWQLLYALMYILLCLGINVDGIHSFKSNTLPLRVNRKWLHICIALSFTKNEMTIFLNGKNIEEHMKRNILR